MPAREPVPGGEVIYHISVFYHFHYLCNYFWTKH